MAKAEASPTKETQAARYQLTEKAYIDDVLHEPERQPKDENGDPKPLIIAYPGIPGPHMKPVNDAAWEASRKAGHVNADGEFAPYRVDPILALTVVGPAAK